MRVEYDTSTREIFERYIAPLRPISTGLSSHGAPNAPVQAILFDLYGTLLVSGSGDIGSDEFTPEKINAIDRLNSEFKLDLSPEKLVDNFSEAIGQEHERMKALGIDYPEVNIENIWSQVLHIGDLEVIRRFALSFELIVNPVYPMPFMGKILSEFSRTGMNLGIISNAQFYTPLTLEHFCGADPATLGFDPDLTVYSYEHGIAKPSPFLFKTALRALERTGIAPGSVIYVGNDMLNDIYAATITGFQTALFAGDRRSLRLRRDDSRCRNLTPDMQITDLRQLAGILDITYRQQNDI